MLPTGVSTWPEWSAAMTFENFYWIYAGELSTCRISSHDILDSYNFGTLNFYFCANIDFNATLLVLEMMMEGGTRPISVGGSTSIRYLADKWPGRSGTEEMETLLPPQQLGRGLGGVAGGVEVAGHVAKVYLQVHTCSLENEMVKVK